MSRRSWFIIYESSSYWESVILGISRSPGHFLWDWRSFGTFNLSRITRRCRWRMLETKCLGENYEMLLTAFWITKIHFCLHKRWAPRWCHQDTNDVTETQPHHPQIVTNITMSPVSLSPWIRLRIDAENEKNLLQIVPFRRLSSRSYKINFKVRVTISLKFDVI